MQLVDDWKKCWKMYSIHAIWVLGALGALADWMPIVREFVPPWVYIAVMTAGIAGRLVSQWGKDEGQG